MALLGGPHQRGAAEIILYVDMGFCLQQGFYGHFVAVVGGPHERRVTVFILKVDVGLVAQQQLQNGAVISSCGQSSAGFCRPILNASSSALFWSNIRTASG